jgi:putative peptidoglycan lipid II flippase
VVEILARASYAMHNTKMPVIIGSVAMGLNILFSLLFSNWFASIGWMPHGGLALANSLATGLEAAALWVFMRRRLAGIEGRWILKGSLQSVIAVIVMSLVLWGWLMVTEAERAWLVGVGGVILGGATYGLCLLVFKVPEVRSVLHFLKRRLKPA